MEECKADGLWKNKSGHWEYDGRFIEWLKNNSEKFQSKSDLSKKLKMHQQCLSKIVKKNNLKLEYTPLKNDANYKAIYQNYDWCYQKFIIEGLNHREMAKLANTKLRTIQKWCCEKHRLIGLKRRNEIKESEIQRDLIIGSLLGDGHIDKRETQPIFIVSHAENQKDYLYWKYNILKNLCNIPPVRADEKVKILNDKSYNCQPSYRCCTRICNFLKKYRDMSKADVINSLNEFSLSIFILDDAYRGESNWNLCVAGFTKNEKEIFIKKMNKDFDLNPYITSDIRYINFRADDSREIDKIILRNIPNNLDIIKNKIFKDSLKQLSKDSRDEYILNNKSELEKDFYYE